MSERKYAVGLTIETIEIGGEEFDFEARRVNVDTIVRANDATSWLLTLVTKAYFRDTEIRGVFDELDDPTTNVAAIQDGLERHVPYVLNDVDLTVEIIDRNFVGKRVEADLAESMIFYE